MSDKFCDSPDKENCCIVGNNIIKDISAELDSEDGSYHGNFILTKKKLFLYDFLIISQESINKTKIQVYKDFCSKMQINNQFRSIY